jgi:hypothetical protein
MVSPKPSSRGLMKLVSIRRLKDCMTCIGFIYELLIGDYDPNNPQPSHFTQVVWKGSQQVGCAVQECSGIFPSQFGVGSLLF